MIELLVVVTITAILASMAIPGIRLFLVQRAVTAASSDLAADFRYARSEALRRSTYVVLCRSSDGSTCIGAEGSWSGGWIIFSDQNNSGTMDGNDAVLRVQGPLNSVTSVLNCTDTAAGTATNTPRSVRFRPQGLAMPGSNDSWVITADASVNKGTVLAVIATTGRLSVRSFGTAC